jgi:PAS domain S-box-containing protein
MVDDQKRIASWNAGAERLFGYRPDEIIGRQATRLFADLDGESDPLAPRMAAARKSGRASGPAMCVARDGEAFAAEATFVRLRDDGGRERGLALLLAPAEARAPSANRAADSA